MKQLMAKHSSLCMKASTMSDGRTIVVQSTCGPESLLLVESAMGRGIQLKVANTNLCLEIPNYNKELYTDVELKDCKRARNQIFTAMQITSETRSFRGYDSKLCLDVLSRSKDQNARIIQYTCHGEAWQQFQTLAAGSTAPGATTTTEVRTPASTAKPIVIAPMPVPQVATTPVATTPVATTPVATTPVATTPVATQPPVVSNTSSVNSVAQIISDMTKLNDAKIKGYSGTTGWSKGSALIMGNCGRGTCAPTYWTASKGPWNTSTPWQALLPWFVVFQAEGNAASNIRIHLRDMKVHIKTNSGQWFVLGQDSGNLEGDIYGMNLIDYVSSANTRKESDGRNSIRPSSNGHIHGWWSTGRLPIDANNIRAVFVTVQARLVVDDNTRADDRANARYMLHVGGDYYPQGNQNVLESTGQGWLPGIGVSRAKYITSQWQSFNMMTLDTAPREQLKNGANVGISEAELISNPPPLQ